jgi:1-acyl-sn-glycerol-3-phosphate acyltransferase
MKFNYKNYPEIIAAKDEYSTSTRRRYPFIAPSLYFYLNLVRIILYSNLKTKFGIYDRYNWSASSMDIFRSLERAGVKFHITGLNNIRDIEGPVIFISNHMSTLETVVLPGLIQPVINVCFITKEELNKYPLFGPVNRARHPIVVGRSNPREDLKIVLEEGKNRLQKGRSILIFPQRTRSKYFDESSFNTLGVKLAQRNKVKIVPIALDTSVWGNGKLIKEFGKIDISEKARIAFGSPIDANEQGAETHKLVTSFIKKSLIEWGKSSYIVQKTRTL